MPQRMLSGKTNSHAQVLKRRAQHAYRPYLLSGSV